MHDTPRTTRRRSRSGFTLIELMIVIAIIGIVSAVAIPQLQAARVTANEASALATLRALASAQAQVAAGAQIDTNADGTGEYAYMAELAGNVPMRIAAAGGPAAGLVGVDELLPAAVSTALGLVENGVASHSGYLFQIWLPGELDAGAIPGVPEDPDGGKLVAPFPDPVQSSMRWCAYAWPMAYASTGVPTYFISNEGEVLRYSNRNALRYEGIGGGPNFDAAYTVVGDMSSPVAMGGLGADGNPWTVLR